MQLQFSRSLFSQQVLQLPSTAVVTGSRRTAPTHNAPTTSIANHAMYIMTTRAGTAALTATVTTATANTTAVITTTEAGAVGINADTATLIIIAATHITPSGAPTTTMSAAGINGYQIYPKKG